MKLDDNNKQPANLFNSVRLFAATLVLITHAYVFFEGYNPSLLGQFTLGQIGVWMFFAVSGYLVSTSWRIDPHIIRFLLRRSLRIFPALFICVLFTALILGPLVTSLNLKNYFFSSTTWKYFTNSALYITYALPGVFEQNRFPNAVNGSLWSLPAEYFMYLCVAVIGVLKFRSYLFIVAAVTFLFFSVTWASTSSDPLVIYRTDFRQVVMCGAVFFIGVIVDRLDLSRMMNIKTSILALVVLIISYYFSLNMHLIFTLCLPVITLSIALAPTKQNYLNKWDISYGLYLYSFPVQQTLAMYYPAMNVWLSIAIAFALAGLLGALSWQYLEKKFLKLKPKKPANCG